MYTLELSNKIIDQYCVNANQFNGVAVIAPSALFYSFSSCDLKSAILENYQYLINN